MTRKIDFEVAKWYSIVRVIAIHLCSDLFELTLWSVQELLEFCGGWETGQVQWGSSVCVLDVGD
jgi:hypothetical protein